jgi:hypothetical protein
MPTPIDTIRKALAGIEHLPWTAHEGAVYDCDGRCVAAWSACYESCSIALHPDDAHLIAHAPQWLAELADRCEAAEAASCTCDDFGDSPCPRHYRENQLQDERDTAIARAERAEGERDEARRMAWALGEAIKDSELVRQRTAGTSADRYAPSWRTTITKWREGAR